MLLWINGATYTYTCSLDQFNTAFSRNLEAKLLPELYLTYTSTVSYKATRRVMWKWLARPVFIAALTAMTKPCSEQTRHDLLNIIFTVRTLLPCPVGLVCQRLAPQCLHIRLRYNKLQRTFWQVLLRRVFLHTLALTVQHEPQSRSQAAGVAGYGSRARMGDSFADARNR